MTTPPSRTVAIVGGGPAGLMAAEVIAEAGHAVTVYERMPSIGRKLLMAGRGGLNLTHSEPLGRFFLRYGDAYDRLCPMVEAFDPAALRAWCEELGEPTLVGSSGRVFPSSLKASPLLRAWLSRLEQLGVRIALRHRWTGWADDGSLAFDVTDRETGKTDKITVSNDATVLAMGGASWAKLGSDGLWVDMLTRKGIAVAPLVPSNCGFTTDWSAHFSERFAGTPLKGIAATFGAERIRGEAMITATGIEGGTVYALSSALRGAIAAQGSATFSIDLKPGMKVDALAARLARPRGKQSVSNFLRKAAGLSPAAIGILREADRTLPDEPAALARLIKTVPVVLTATQPIERAISTAGGIAFDQLDDGLMFKTLPGVFAAGEMLDWEAPTGGYLLQATFATGVAAGRGVVAWLAEPTS